MTKFKTFLKYLGKGIFLILIILFLSELILYFMTPIYSFPLPQPFSGDKIYNPYARMDSTQWHKVNFHFHTRSWGGLTNGRKNTHEALYKTYRSLGYDAFQISNYMKIDRKFQDSSFYIPCYEHGVGFQKTHQLVIGAREVLWKDFSVFQNIHHRQNILNLLRSRSEVVALAHPDWDKGYTVRNMQLLSNYDLVEALNHNWRSVYLWDAALSTGHPVFIVADDDAHDITNPYQIGRCATFINSPAVSAHDLIAGLKSGNAFGANIYMANGESFEQKAAFASQLPKVRCVQVQGDTLKVAVSQKAMKFTFIGQNGKILKSTEMTDQAWYKITPEDTYVRTEILFPKYFADGNVVKGTTYYLNPVFRYNGEKPDNGLKAEIDWIRTWIFRLCAIPSLFVLVILIIWQREKHRRKLNKPDA
ncbi:MAG: hypothetical protein Q8867_07175 [Bacteroidota bacterium]|nr:hypothetical protein [Bacteroidota bacterium]